MAREAKTYEPDEHHRPGRRLWSRRRQEASEGVIVGAHIGYITTGDVAEIVDPFRIAVIDVGIVRQVDVQC
jgi:hypothetical protein